MWMDHWLVIILIIFVFLIVLYVLFKLQDLHQVYAIVFKITFYFEKQFSKNFNYILRVIQWPKIIRTLKNPLPLILQNPMSLNPSFESLYKEHL